MTEEATALQTWRLEPLVLAMDSDEVRSGSLADLLPDDSSPGRFVVVLAAAAEELGSLLRAVQPFRQEVVFTDGPDTDGQTLAERALEQHGLGQDFVFTVPNLINAVDYVLDLLLDEGQRGWEGDAVLVVGPVEALTTARVALAAAGRVS